MQYRKATGKTNVASLNHVCPDTFARMNSSERIFTKIPIWVFVKIANLLKNGHKFYCILIAMYIYRLSKRQFVKIVTEMAPFKVHCRVQYSTPSVYRLEFFRLGWNCNIAVIICPLISSCRMAGPSYSHSFHQASIIIAVAQITKLLLTQFSPIFCQILHQTPQTLHQTPQTLHQTPETINTVTWRMNFKHLFCNPITKWLWRNDFVCFGQ